MVAAITDFLDGYLARRWQTTSFLGTLIDPVGDKSLALAYSWVFWSDGLLDCASVLILFSRDLALVFFSMVLIACGKRRQWKIQSFWCGKIATALQAVVIVLLCGGVTAPAFLYGLLALSGIGSFFELLYRLRHPQTITLMGHGANCL